MIGKATASNNFFNGAAAGDSCISAPSHLLFGIGSAEKLRLDSSGRLLLNTTVEGNAGADDLTIGQISGSTGITIRSGTTNNGNLYFSDGTSGDDEFRGSIQYQHANNSLHIATNAIERLLIDSAGRVLIGATANNVLWGVSAALQVEGTSYDTSAITISRNTNDSGGAYLILGKSRGTSDGSHTIVQSGDTIGSLAFAGADGGDQEHTAAYIQAAVDGTPGSNDMPGRLSFFTTADGASSGTERLTIKATGKVGIGENSPDELLHIKNSSAGGYVKVEGPASGDISSGYLIYRDTTLMGGIYSNSDSSAPGATTIVSEDHINIRVNNGNRLEITDSNQLLPWGDGDHDLGSSSKRFRDLYLSSGVFLGGTGSANELTDYEEGSWTPSFGNVTVSTYGTQYGRYCKVGSQVMLVGQITVDSGLDTSDGSAINISGLPFSGNSAAGACQFTFGQYTSILTQTSLDGFTNVRFGGNYVMLHEGSNDDISYQGCNSSGIFQFAISYIMNT